MIGFSAISVQLLFHAIFLAYGLGLGAVLGISTVSATFFWIFSGFLTAFGVGLGAVFAISAVSATFFSDFFRLLGLVWELFWGFLRFQLLFSGFFSAFGLILGAVLKVL